MSGTPDRAPKPHSNAIVVRGEEESIASASSVFAIVREIDDNNNNNPADQRADEEALAREFQQEQSVAVIMQHIHAFMSKLHVDRDSWILPLTTASRAVWRKFLHGAVYDWFRARDRVLRNAREFTPVEADDQRRATHAYSWVVARQYEKKLFEMYPSKPKKYSHALFNVAEDVRRSAGKLIGRPPQCPEFLAIRTKHLYGLVCFMAQMDRLVYMTYWDLLSRRSGGIVLPAEETIDLLKRRVHKLAFDVMFRSVPPPFTAVEAAELGAQASQFTKFFGEPPTLWPEQSPRVAKLKP